MKEGDKPDFALKDQHGKVHKFSDYKGKKIILYFYPKDDTPGCTKEACGFRDAFALFKKHNAVILGISADDEVSHKTFAEKYDLPFTLLSDPEKKVIEQFGVWKEKSMYGKTFFGIVRTTFLMDEQGVVKKIFPKVNPEEHAKEILDAL
ncbi:thioredoxin-dependent thiol peroxidase [Candidatus Woesearchaeota archaeon]|nr:MAG: thioredoxin-dependent thiol peroxidase [Candidatus Woesearchaeota archaeon]